MAKRKRPEPKTAGEAFREILESDPQFKAELDAAAKRLDPKIQAARKSLRASVKALAEEPSRRDRRLKEIEKLIDDTVRPKPDHRNWLTQAAVARGLGFPKTQRYKVAHLVKAGVLRTNGKPGRACRIDPASVLEYCEAQELTWNET